MYAVEHEDISQKIAEDAEERFGIVPNLIKQLFAHPIVAQIYADGAFALQDKGVLSPDEQHVLFLYISNYNDCHYCKVAHAFAVKRSAQLSDADFEHLKKNEKTGNDRYNALTGAAQLILEKRGKLSKSEMNGLSEQGVDKTTVYEIIGLVALKTITNYTNHIANTVVDFPAS